MKVFAISSGVSNNTHSHQNVQKSSQQATTNSMQLANFPSSMMLAQFSNVSFSGSREEIASAKLTAKAREAESEGRYGDAARYQRANQEILRGEGKDRDAHIVSIAATKCEALEEAQRELDKK